VLQETPKMGKYYMVTAIGAVIAKGDIMGGNKGWSAWEKGEYGGKEIALNICKTCKYFRHDKTTSVPYVCTVGRTPNAGYRLSHGEWPQDCEEFAQVESKSKSKSKGSGRKKPIWLRIICFPCCCIWHSKGFTDPSTGCKKACNW
jgi:hypothetical protein